MKTRWIVGLLVAGLIGPGATPAADPATDEAQAAFLRAEALAPAAQQDTLAVVRQHRALCRP